MKPTTVDGYIASLPAERREAMASVREIVRKNLPDGYEEGIQYGMIGWYVPHDLYPAGYHANPKEPLPFVSLGSQKSHMALYLMCVYGDAVLGEWFRAEYAKSGKRLDMGKSCVRFKKLDDLALDVVARTVARVPVKKFVAAYEASLASHASAKRTTSRAKAPAPRKSTAKRPSAKR
jgi:Domain of unknown function (DU1801)